MLYAKDANTVKGVKIKRKQDAEKDGEKDQKGTVREDMEADFVVCAAGRKNQVKKWLQELDIINDSTTLSQTCYPGLGYCTSQWALPEGELWIPAPPPHPLPTFPQG